MNCKDIVRLALDEYMSELRKALDGLTAEERRFQPSPDSHHIDFAVWHMARVEDGWVSGTQSIDLVWQTEGWPQKLELPEDDGGSGYTAEQVASLPEFDIDDMMAYYDSVRRETYRYLDGLSNADFDSVPFPENYPEHTVGKVFSHVIVEESQHVGQIAYLRGIQRGLNR